MSVRPTVLWVTAEPPNSALGGGNIRQAELLTRLARRIDVDLLVLGDQTGEDVRAAVRSVTEIDPVEPVARPRWRRRLDTADLLVRRRLTVATDRQLAEAADLVTVARERDGDYDVVIARHEPLAAAAPGSRRSRWLLELHHLESPRLRQRASTDERIGRWRHTVEAANAARWLRKLAPSWDGLVVVSDADASQLPAGTDVCVVPNGVDLERFAPTDRPIDGPVLLTASLDYFPNVDGIEWFVDTVWPLIRARHPDRELHIVGRSPGPDIYRRDGVAGVRVFADVPSIPPYLQAASVAVVPLRIGTGTRLKALEAMAAGRPVVGTTVGLEGLGVVGGRHVQVADDAVGFATAVIDLLDEPTTAAAMASAARRHVEDHFGWDAIAERYAASVLAAGEF